MFFWLTMSFLILSRKIIQPFYFLCLSPPGNWWCDIPGFVPTGSVSSSSTLQIFKYISHLWWLLWLKSICSVISFDFGTSRIAYPQKSSHGCGILLNASLGFPFHISLLFCSMLTESVRMMACVVWMSSLKTIHWRACVAASTSTVKLEVEIQTL